ncbi:MAG: fibrillarin-like rRNA/tRNA 2'-O-methyltransferase [Nanoarchaeota archaeon]|nr:fibrillarin-like rRNA/tRNA 2'-O-methyltransferase [Nanoarchaeota archaeon]MBU1321218.1 fibrillarin-like rRNA/tRNA 2'-O-methyltransferase [Nanoarchaeota archaeon]MBU1597023.1 fibrillarin-like rRNA/tRNA 2'-O-methyltransferase [Nanoarchaeota archaeon]MBU2441831.1 fibrillarin-like rRNA/tRNA 2'-O-methyltransferase [Nanoarchaeota archaeon]
MKQINKFNVFDDGKSRRNLFTKNLTKGKRFFDEDFVHSNGVEFRAWDVFRSKLGASIMKGVSQIGLKPGSLVLYLGASHGFTPSYVSDIVENDGFVFCVDNAPRVVRDLIFLCEQRKNMSPILADANHPENYKDLVTKEVDVVFQDIAQRNQVEIFLKNCAFYLKKGGFGLLALKARSVDVARRPSEIFKEVRKQLEESEMLIVDQRNLEPYERDHAMFVCKKK